MFLSPYMVATPPRPPAFWQHSRLLSTTAGILEKSLLLRRTNQVLSFSIFKSPSSSSPPLLEVFPELSDIEFRNMFRTTRQGFSFFRTMPGSNKRIPSFILFSFFLESWWGWAVVGRAIQERVIFFFLILELFLHASVRVKYGKNKDQIQVVWHV